MVRVRYCSASRAAHHMARVPALVFCGHPQTPSTAGPGGRGGPGGPGGAVLSAEAGNFGIEVIYGSSYWGLNLILGIGLKYHSSAGYSWMVAKREPWQAFSHDNRYQFRDHYDSEAGMCK
jgi:hypothetical protein